MVVKDKIKALREALEQHNYNYYVLSAPTISDREFDEMMKELQILEEAHPEYADPHSPTQRVGSDLSKEFEQVVHKYPMHYLFKLFGKVTPHPLGRRMRIGIFGMRLFKDL